jgi:capsule polysaccharide export protein KpsE/RkpR
LFLYIQKVFYTDKAGLEKNFLKETYNMGFAASQARFVTLTARKSDLELQGQFINQSRMQLANITGNLFTISSNLEPESPEAQQLQARIAALQAVDKSLELQLRRVDTQHDAVQTEIDAVRKVIGKNIESTFKTFG